MNEQVFNPLNKENLGISVVEALLKTKEFPLSTLENFTGAGIYAIYYRGPFKPYEKLARKNRSKGTLPIYIGKAIPKGGRKGMVQNLSLTSRSLYSRLRDHLESLKAAENLDPEDFSYRYLIVDDIWIGLGESLMIQRYQPLWNQVVDGFGNHDPGKGRHAGMKPLWDELHPGRPWAKKCSPPKMSKQAILEVVAEKLK